MRATLRGLFWFLSAGWWPAALNAAIYERLATWFIHEPQRIDWFPVARLVWGSDIDPSRDAYKAILLVDVVEGVTTENGTITITHESSGLL